MSSSGKKIAAGTGAAGLLVALVHVVHGIFTLQETHTPYKFEPPRHTEKVQFIMTDSLGHRDTLDFNGYLRRGDSLKRKHFKLEKAEVLRDSFMQQFYRK